jgi:hypothetical protein
VPCEAHTETTSLSWRGVSMHFIGLTDLQHKISIPSSVQLPQVPASTKTGRQSVLSKLSKVFRQAGKMSCLPLSPALPERGCQEAAHFVPAHGMTLFHHQETHGIRAVGVERYFHPLTLFSLFTRYRTIITLCVTLWVINSNPLEASWVC